MRLFYRRGRKEHAENKEELSLYTFFICALCAFSVFLSAVNFYKRYNIIYEWCQLIIQTDCIQEGFNGFKQAFCDFFPVGVLT